MRTRAQARGISLMKPLPHKLGIVAGGGALPQRLLAFCDSRQIETYVVGFEGHTLPQTLEGREHMLTRLGAAGQIITHLKALGYKDLVIIGSVKRPKLSQMRPDWKTASFFARLGFRALGDDGLLKAVRAELESEGFTIHGIQEIMDDILIPHGVLGAVMPSDAQYEDIRIGLNEARDLGQKDIGQSVIVMNEDVLGVEDEEGTNALIRRAGCKGAILVKNAKPQQDRKLDMPTLGPDTIRLCADMGFAGIAAEREGVLLVDREEMVALANKAGMFLVGV